jgi:DNA-binding NarL/FixJ family response regulator
MSGQETGSILKIVTVDDSPIVAERLQSMLSEVENVEFLGNARNIASALALIDQTKPDVVLLDIHLEEDMPDANGIDLLISLRKKYPIMKIMMLTNLTGFHYRNRCIAFGVDYFFDKSNDFDKIPGTLKEIMRSTR